ncbi:MAG TPA: hypothetical protein VL093_11035 [Flavipsychrobacter sp.]|nr:hypothetical protein [Flavipsychrobacter sp.]
MRTIYLLLPILLLGCSQPDSKKKEIAVERGHAPAANTVVASDSMRIPDDLNKLYFSIEVIASPESDKGVYEVLVSYGHNDASGQVVMPEADELIVPELRRDTAQFSYIIGFHYGSDTSFKDYFLVKADRGRTEMRYLKAYSFK